MKGANPFLVSNQELSVFHYLSYYGHLNCLKLILQHEIHLLRTNLYNKIKELMATFDFRTTDAKNGKLVRFDNHLPKVQSAFTTF